VIRNKREFCGNSKNKAIGGGQPITSDTTVTILQFLTAIAVVTYPPVARSLTVGVLGTNKGTILKVSTVSILGHPWD
jgi:hypothetical protein